MSFLARCPKCGEFQICVTSVENAVNLKCRRCSLVYTPVEESLPTHDVNWSLAMTMAGHEFEPPRTSLANLVVIQDLPSVYPKRRSSKRRRPKRRRTRVAHPRNESISASPSILDVPPPQETVATEEAVADPTSPPIEQPAPVVSQASIPIPQFTLPPPEHFVRPARKVIDEEDTEYGWLELNRTSIAALFLLVAGLLISASTPLRTIPLIAIILSLSVGGFATRYAHQEGRRLVIPIGIVVVAAVVVLLTVTSSGFTGRSGDRGGSPPPTMNEVMVVPHPRFASDPQVRTAEWVDAGKASLSQSGMRVEVIEARSSSRGLSIRIRLHRAAGIPGLSGGTFSWNEKVVAAIYDDGGNSHEQISVATQPVSPENRLGAGIEAIDVVLLFPTAPVTNGMRLELPATAWGGSGTFKFAIPRTMMKR